MKKKSETHVNTKVNNQIGRSKEDKVSKKHDRRKWIKNKPNGIRVHEEKPK